ncbi:MAG: YihY/virulence factor BrkB family protein [Bacteroidetes bacterium]|nr:YihY/virulence factor BrkB family protein [Bacteroidota bacterium]
MKPLISFSKQLKLQGFEGLPLFNVAHFFIQRLRNNDLQTRARSLAFSFFLALFPTVIFIFTLIPYIPIPSFPEQLLLVLKDFLPANTFETARETIEDILLRQRGGLLSFGFFFALYVSADGIMALMTWFNKSYHGKELRPGWKMKLMAIGITLTLALFVFMAIGLILTFEYIYYYLEEKKILVSFMQLILISIGKWVILLGLCFSAISLLFYYGPSEKNKLKFISAGSSLATFLIILTSLGFNYFLTNFGQYNKVYGSIGTLIVFLIWLYINSFVLLVGYELNVSIKKAK